MGELPASAQAKLLRVVEDGLVEPLGTNQAVKVDVRLVSATHRNLRQMIEQGRFRQDLYFRLNALGVTVPPLRERPGDLSLLVEHFLRQSVPADRPLPSITPRAWAALASYAFPGNVRELRHAITQAVLLARDEPVDLAHLPADIAGGAPESDDPGLSVVPLTAALRSFEREYLQRVLASTSGRRAEAAALLGISRKTLWEKLRSHALCQGDEDP